MKRINFKIIIPTLLLLSLVVVACSKSFLDKPPQGVLNPATVANEAGVQGILIGAYALADGAGAAGDDETSAASNWVFGGVAGDDAYKGSDPTDFSSIAVLEDWSVNATSDVTIHKWKLCYTGAQRCNDVLNTLPLATDIPAAEGAQIRAQAVFLRAFYHMELKKVYGNIIYADTTVNPSFIDVSNTTDVWPKIEEDLNYAIANLPASWSGDVGRANSWAAKAMLAKAYMYEGKLSAAYPILKDIIGNGVNSAGAKYALYPGFFSNFNPAQKNGTECIFAAQTSVQDGSSVDWGADPNGNYGDILNFPYTGGPGACCGFYNPSQDLANAFKTDANGLPLLDTWFTGLNVSDESNTSLYTGTLDPRIDLTMGRPGIPYLDWGPVPVHIVSGKPVYDWIRNQVNDGNKSPRKNVYAASQKNFTDLGSAYWAPTELVANNINLIRLADVILWAAECAADAGDLGGAMGYVNQIRQRAANPLYWVYKYPKNTDGTDDLTSYDAPTTTYKVRTTPADNYKIGLYTSFPSKDYAVKAIQFERRLELAMEGQRYFDLVRWGTADQVLNAYYGREKAFRPLKNNAHWTKGKNEILPIPQSEIDNMNSDGTVRLTQNPGYN
jgi:starch-binding outer membrane protein, SusD/RagB family